ncbi:MAG: hypothetical protein QNJ46_08650 [Leptolyngbyaceae cyanobacterium MO_188.B28]|nr:hypothetical protein [Leptolyngbyaceae cyanobacterium MO_188.B28]
MPAVRDRALFAAAILLLFGVSRYEALKGEHGILTYVRSLNTSLAKLEAA